MTDIKAMKTKEWKLYRDLLEEELNNVGWRHSRIVRTAPAKIVVEGGSLPIEYDIENNTCTVWGKCARYSHGYVLIDKLIQVKTVLEKWGELI